EMVNAPQQAYMLIAQTKVLLTGDVREGRDVRTIIVLFSIRSRRRNRSAGNSGIAGCSISLRALCWSRLPKTSGSRKNQEKYRDDSNRRASHEDTSPAEFTAYPGSFYAGPSCKERFPAKPGHAVQSCWDSHLGTSFPDG